MVLHFGYIEGINRIDTPRFTTLAIQTEWMDSKEQVHIDTTFYPPHYKNKIRVSTEDIDFNTSINYLWFEYQRKRYYYFIDSIDYINEDLIEFDITMDYIQTYMFNIRVTNSIIERKFINRLIKDENNNRIINRNYIREDVSSKLYEKQPKHYFRDNEKYAIILKMTQFTTGTSNIFRGTVIDDEENIYNDSFQYWIYIPSNTATAFRYNGVDYPTNKAYDCLVEEIMAAPVCIDAYYVPISGINGISIIGGTTIAEITNIVVDGIICTPSFYGGSLQYTFAPIVRWLGTISGAQNPSAFLQFGGGIIDEFYQYNDRYIDNPALYEPVVGDTFRVNNIPALCDENYSYFAIGNEYTTVVIPTHYYKRGRIKALLIFNLVNGTTNINCDFTYEDNNNYGLCTVDTNIKNLNLVNDTYIQYVANNSNRWSTAGLKAGLSAVDAVVSVVSTATFAGLDISRVLKDKRNYTKVRQQLKVGSQRQIQNIKTRTAESVVDDTAGLISGIISPLVNQKIQDENMMMAPDNPKQFGDGISILLSPLHKFFYQEYKVRDFEQCAQYYHRNGYKVLEYTNEINDIFSYFDNRYYFNIMKFSDINLHLLGVIEDEETLAGIEERLMDGIRAWNVQRTGVVIGDFTYDNCENDYLGGA